MSPGGAGPEAGRGTLALDAHVDALDGGPPVRRHRPRAPHRFRGPGPVEEITVHALDDPPHWHLVTYGLSELHAKESSDRVWSGWGFELTFRVARSAGGEAAGGEGPGGGAAGEEPLWAVDLLANLAAYVWSSHHPFAAGHHVDLRGPIRLGADTALTAAMIVVDPTLGVLSGPFGRVELLQVVGITAEELDLCRSWSTEGVRDLLARDDPLLVTRLDRRPVTADPRWQAEIAARAAADGSALTELRVGTLRWRRRWPGRGVTVTMGAGTAAALGPALRRELIGSGASFAVVGDTGSLRFAVAEEAGWAAGPAGVDVAVPLGEVAALADLFDGRTGAGRHPSCPAVRFRVVP